MNQTEDWKLVQIEIESFKDAFKIACLGNNNGSRLHFTATNKSLCEFAEHIYEIIKVFSTTYTGSLADIPRKKIDDFLNDYPQGYICQNDGEGTVIRNEVVKFTTLGSTIGSLLNDIDIKYIPRIERAFAHLQRLLIADDDFRYKWRNAFNTKRKGERECEKLGGTHLLWHGIYAFKADTPGARTDLVLSSSINPELAKQSADVLLLTEWKIAKNRNDYEKKRIAGIEQAAIYSKDPLLGFELSHTRFVVVVSTEKYGHEPDIVNKDNIRYVVKNIAIDPATPSKQSAAISAKATQRKTASKS